ncbi:TauD/TfdA family dioxygenase [Legionella brunensis]|uniref:Pyoverdine biosynthesis protein PvcB n=1 Tax=Legionella brunensis TaxID=29422 RepID=A0A0W0S3R3_9GAMM|nr:TauD/TfdA family dioxygenase [Legionella brunensis]KTC78191.1 pyoverdine biosynthesis protein PvcB [Legionella brunensis]
MMQTFKPHLIQTTQNLTLATWKLGHILELVTRHKLVILRGFSAMECQELLDYCQSQASLVSWDFGSVMEMKVDKNARNYLFTEGDVPLHWDGAFYQEPRFLFFHCLKAPTINMGGETLFVNTEMVWSQATPCQQERWLNYQLQFATEKLAHYGGKIVRNLVNTHPQTERTILRFAEPVGEDYLNPVHVTVLDTNEVESKQILTEISECMRTNITSYFHQWQQGDYLIADNFSLLHGRNAFRRHTPRHLRRIQIL